MRLSRLRPKAFLVGTVVSLFVLALACGPAATPTPTATPSPTRPAPTPTPTPTTGTIPTPTAATPTGATATPTNTPVVVIPTATPTPTVVARQEAPEPKNPVGTLVFVINDVPSGVGLGSAQAPVEPMKDWGAGETLFRPSLDGRDFVTPWLAKSFNMAPDLSKVTIQLQEGVQFHDGWGEMTADDVAWTLNDANGALNPTSIHGQAGDFAALFGEVKALDRYTIEIPFKAFDPRWNSNFTNLAGQAFVVFSKRIYDEKGADWMRDNLPVGTGPYDIIEWVKDDRAVLEALPTHWDKPGQVKTLRFVEIPETATRVAMMRTGEADVATLPLKEIPPLLDGGFVTGGIGSAQELLIAFSGNLWEEKHAVTGQPLDYAGVYAADHPWVGNPFSPNDRNNPPGMDDMEQARLVRWALAMAYDREALNEQLQAGLGWPTYIGFFSPKDPNWDDKFKVPYDPQKAKEFLAQAGFPNGFEVQIFGQSDTEIRSEIADAVGGYWQQIGLKVTVLHYPYAVFRPSIVSRSNVVPHINSCDDSRTPNPWDWPRALTFTSRTRGGFSCSVESPFIAETFAKVAGEPDPAKRLAMNLELLEYLHHQMLAAGTIAVPDLIVWNPKSIREWQMRPGRFCCFNSTHNIMPAR